MEPYIIRPIAIAPDLNSVVKFVSEGDAKSRKSFVAVRRHEREVVVNGNECGRPASVFAEDVRDCFAVLTPEIRHVDVIFGTSAKRPVCRRSFEAKNTDFFGNHCSHDRDHRIGKGTRAPCDRLVLGIQECCRIDSRGVKMNAEAVPNNGGLIRVRPAWSRIESLKCRLCRQRERPTGRVGRHD